MIFRIEPGCLGPEGISHADKFCVMAATELRAASPHFIKWQVEPRHNKQLPEMDFAINGRALNRELAARYFEHFDKDLEQFELDIFDHLPELIDHYFGR